MPREEHYTTITIVAGASNSHGEKASPVCCPVAIAVKFDVKSCRLPTHCCNGEDGYMLLC